MKTSYLPLFFVVLLLFILIPQVYAPASIQFKSLCGNVTAGATTLNCTLSGMTNGDAVIVSIFGVGVFNSFTVTDSQLNTYTQRVSSVSGNGAGASTYIVTTLSGSASTTDTVTVATGGATRIYGFDASDYSGVTGFGKTGTDQQDTAGNSGTSTITLSGTLGSSTMVDDFAIGGSTFTITTNNGQTIRDSSTSCPQQCRAADTTSPVLGLSWSGGSGCQTPPACFMSHSTLELQGGAATAATAISQCYGNCGNPPVTLVNTNSTHSINFNQSITLFYKFQSNLNGVINNVTVSVAKTYSNSITMQQGIYIVSNCPLGSDPFTLNCPGSLQRVVSTFNPQKGKNTFSIGNLVVISGQWIGISVTATFQGLDLNDTNSNISLFQTNGMSPQIIQSNNQFTSCACKMGLWTWITGNVITGGGPNNPPIAPTCGNGIGDYLTCLTLSFCTGTPNAGCQLAGGLFWAMIYSAVGIVGIMWIDHKFLGTESGVHVPPSAYAFIPVGVQFMFISLGVLPVWWGILLIMVFTVLFTWMLLGFARGSGGRPS